MKKVILVIIMIIVLLSIKYISYRFEKLPSLGEYYVVDFEMTGSELTEEERNVLIKVLNSNDATFEKDYVYIGFTKLAYECYFQNDSTFYLFFLTNGNGKEIFLPEKNSLSSLYINGNQEYVYKHACIGHCINCKKSL